MKQRVYIDTSVVGGYHDVEFKEYTIPLFERIKHGEFTILKDIMSENKKTFDAVLFMRQQRNRLSEMLSKMTKEEVVQYLRKKELETTIRPC